MVSQSLWRMISLIMCLVQVHHAISSLNVPGRLAKERIPCTDVLCCKAMSGRRRREGGGLNSLLMASFKFEAASVMIIGP